MGHYAYFKDTEGNILGLWENLPADAGGASG
jgi:predicted enzyme related to lactoylglutathione lyase